MMATNQTNKNKSQPSLSTPANKSSKEAIDTISSSKNLGADANILSVAKT